MDFFSDFLGYMEFGEEMWNKLKPMQYNYEERKVARYEEGNLLVSTCRADDCTPPYETAISHPYYRGGNWIVVQIYETKEEAEKEHEKWVQMMTSENLPDELIDIRASRTFPDEDISEEDFVFYKDEY